MSARNRFAAALATALCVSIAPHAGAFSSPAALPAILGRARPLRCSPPSMKAPGDGRRGFLMGSAAAAFVVAGGARGVDAAAQSAQCSVFPGCDVNGVPRVGYPFRSYPEIVPQTRRPVPARLSLMQARFERTRGTGAPCILQIPTCSTEPPISAERADRAHTLRFPAASSSSLLLSSLEYTSL